MKQSKQEFISFISSNYYPSYSDRLFMFPVRYEYEEKISIFVDDGVIWFDKCVYCGSVDKYINKNLLGQDCCGHCNAPIGWENYQ